MNNINSSLQHHDDFDVKDSHRQLFEDELYTNYLEMMQLGYVLDDTQANDQQIIHYLYSNAARDHLAITKGLDQPLDPKDPPTPEYFAQYPNPSKTQLLDLYARKRGFRSNVDAYNHMRQLVLDSRHDPIFTHYPIVRRPLPSPPQSSKPSDQVFDVPGAPDGEGGKIESKYKSQSSLTSSRKFGAPKIQDDQSDFVQVHK